MDFFFLTIMQNGDGVTIGNDFGWPGKTSGRYGEKNEEKGEAGTAHAVSLN